MSDEELTEDEKKAAKIMQCLDEITVTLGLQPVSRILFSAYENIPDVKMREQIQSAISARIASTLKLSMTTLEHELGKVKDNPGDYLSNILDTIKPKE